MTYDDFEDFIKTRLEVSNIAEATAGIIDIVAFNSFLDPLDIINVLREYLDKNYKYFRIKIAGLYTFSENLIIICFYPKEGLDDSILDNDNILWSQETESGLIFKTEYDYNYFPNFDIIKSEYLPCRKKRHLKFYCKNFPYNKAAELFKKYTNKKLSEATYLKYNLG